VRLAHLAALSAMRAALEVLDAALPAPEPRLLYTLPPPPTPPSWLLGIPCMTSSSLYCRPADAPL